MSPFASCLAQSLDPTCIDLWVLGLARVNEEWRIHLATQVDAVASSDVRAAACRPRAASIQRIIDVGRRSCSAFVLGVVEGMVRFVHVIGTNSHVRQEGVGEDSAGGKGARLIDGESIFA